jgi:hypothetical protein
MSNVDWRRRFRPAPESLEQRHLPSAAWQGFAGNGQHTAVSNIMAQSLEAIRWQTPVDLQPQYSGDDLLIHYGSPMVTMGNTVLIPVKTGASGGFEIQARNGINGQLKWTVATDYLLPPNGGWVPSFSPTLTPQGRLYYQGAGGTIYYIDNVDSTAAPHPVQIAFYGIKNYNHAAFDNTVFIDTPLTSDGSGNVFFGFEVIGSSPPLGLASGIAKIDAHAHGIWRSTSVLAGGTNLYIPVNSAPAISGSGAVLYVAVNNGQLLELNSATLALINKVTLRDPSSGQVAILPNQGTASPMVGPDGDVYMGVLENPFPYNNDRGWMLHFSADLRTTKTPGAFGWDDTASVVPKSMVPSYHGTSLYLLMTKYNNYAGIYTGNGQNKIAILDPNQMMLDPVSGASVMKEVLTMLGPTPDDEHPGGVREWCINTAVVDPPAKSVYANSEDGVLYRWNLATNTFTQAVRLTDGIGEAYTPTLIGQDGTVYAINNATLFAVGRMPVMSSPSFQDAAAIVDSSSRGANIGLTTVLAGSAARPPANDIDVNLSRLDDFLRCETTLVVPVPGITGNSHAMTSSALNTWSLNDSFGGYDWQPLMPER